MGVKSLIIVDDSSNSGDASNASNASIAIINVSHNSTIGLAFNAANNMTKAEYIENETKKILMETVCESLAQICIEYLKDDEVVDFSEIGVGILSNHMLHMGAMDIGLGEVLKSYKGRNYSNF